MIINLKGDLWSSDHAKVYDVRKTEHSSKYERIATVGGVFIHNQKVKHPWYIKT